MADNITFSGVRDANVRRCEESFRPLNAWSPMEYGCALAGEIGEACNLIKKLQSKHDHPEREELIDDIADELADAFTYLDLIAARLGIDLAEAIARKFNVVSKRVESRITLSEGVRWYYVRVISFSVDGVEHIRAWVKSKEEYKELPPHVRKHYVRLRASSGYQAELLAIDRYPDGTGSGAGKAKGKECRAALGAALSALNGAAGEDAL